MTLLVIANVPASAASAVSHKRFRFHFDRGGDAMIGVEVNELASREGRRVWRTTDGGARRIGAGSGAADTGPALHFVLSKVTGSGAEAWRDSDSL